jgi:hypothetical protein
MFSLHKCYVSDIIHIPLKLRVIPGCCALRIVWHKLAQA